MDQVYLIAFATYIGVLAAITTFFYKKSSSSEEFVLGNRSLNYAASAIAAHSSDMSIWLFMGFPGAVYLAGMQKVWLPIGLIIGMYCSWTFVAKKLRIATEQYNSVTLSEFFEHRFEDKSGMLRIVSALMALLFFLFYISSGLVGMGIMFESVFGLNYHIGVMCGLLTAVIYTLIGGFVGVAWCDLFQGLFLVAMIVLVPIVGYSMLGDGWEQIADVAQLKNISLSLFQSPKETISGILLALGWGLGYFGQPHILVNFMGIKDVNSINKAKYVGMTWQLFTLVASVAVGLIGIGLFTTTLANPELVFVTMVQTSFTPFFAGFVLCSIIAAGLTTVDTQILVSASIFSEDIYKRFFNPKATPKQTLLVSRIGVVIVPLMSYMIAFSKSATVYGLVAYAWNGLGSTFGPVILTSLYSKRVTRNGALFGMIAGGTIAALWPLAGSTVPAMIPGFFTNLGIIFLMSQ